MLKQSVLAVSFVFSLLMSSTSVATDVPNHTITLGFITGEAGGDNVDDLDFGGGIATYEYTQGALVENLGFYGSVALLESDDVFCFGNQCDEIEVTILAAGVSLVPLKGEPIKLRLGLNYNELEFLDDDETDIGLDIGVLYQFRPSFVGLLGYNTELELFNFSLGYNWQ